MGAYNWQGRLAGLVLAAIGAGVSAGAGAQQIAVGNFGVSANGMPYAVATELGLFKAEGINVTGIITSAGGGTSLRNMLAGGVPFGEVNPGELRRKHPGHVQDVVGIDEEHRLLSDILGAGGPAVCLPSRGRV